MTKFDNKFIPNIPKTFQVLELRDQQQEQQTVKKSPLSSAARSKVINRSGSNYVSESREEYGPCRNRRSFVGVSVFTYGYDCPCTKQQLLQQLSEAEREISQLKDDARNDMDGFGDKLKEYDQKGESYRSFVKDHLEGNKYIENCKAISALVLFKIPGADKITDLYGDIVATIAGESDAATMKTIYNDYIVRTYNNIKDWYNSARRKYN